MMESAPTECLACVWTGGLFRAITSQLDVFSITYVMRYTVDPPFSQVSKRRITQDLCAANTSTNECLQSDRANIENDTNISIDCGARGALH